jgi:hypothetical protein
MSFGAVRLALASMQSAGGGQGIQAKANKTLMPYFSERHQKLR